MNSPTYRIARIFLFGLCIASAGCAVNPRRTPSEEVRAAHTAEGEATAAAMQARFDAVLDSDPLNASCDGPRTPVFLCSGILLRGTGKFSEAYHAWNPNPNSTKPGGVSFSFLRRDASYIKLAYGYNHGFTVWPVFQLPQGKFEMEVLCYFPMDGATDLRSDAGCGPHRDHPTESVPCQQKDPPILTGAAWLADYNDAPAGTSKRDQSCGFTMVSGTSNSAALFKEAMHVQHLYRGAFFESQDEAIIATWETGLEKTIPLESFIFLAGTDGHVDSKGDQNDFYVTSKGIWRPIIRVTLPREPNGEAHFEYHESDQAIP